MKKHKVTILHQEFKRRIIIKRFKLKYNIINVLTRKNYLKLRY